MAGESLAFPASEADEQANARERRVVRGDQARLAMREGDRRASEALTGVQQLRIQPGQSRAPRTGAEEPYDKLRRALRAETDEAAWSCLDRMVSRAFPGPESGRTAVTVISYHEARC